MVKEGVSASSKSYVQAPATDVQLTTKFPVLDVMGTVSVPGADGGIKETVQPVVSTVHVLDPAPCDARTR
jgi:hypothetical protein